MDKITIERETLRSTLDVLTEMPPSPGKALVVSALRAALAAQPADAQPTGQSPCARHCEAPAFEGEIRRLKREATIKDSLTIRPPAPAAVPLTDEQIDDICWNFNCSNTPLVEYDRLIARAIERAHGIAAAGDKP